MEQTDPDGLPEPADWRINIYQDVKIDDDEDELFEPIITREVETFTRSDDWGVSPIPEVVELGGLVFGEAGPPQTPPSAVFVGNGTAHRESAVRGREKPAPSTEA